MPMVAAGSRFQNRRALCSQSWEPSSLPAVRPEHAARQKWTDLKLKNWGFDVRRRCRINFSASLLELRCDGQAAKFVCRPAVSFGPQLLLKRPGFAERFLLDGTQFRNALSR